MSATLAVFPLRNAVRAARRERLVEALIETYIPPGGGSYYEIEFSSRIDVHRLRSVAFRDGSEFAGRLECGLGSGGTLVIGRGEMRAFRRLARRANVFGWSVSVDPVE